MSEEEAMRLLAATIGERKEEEEDERNNNRALVNELGCLPLALSQAGAYIKKKMINVKEYRKQYEQSLILHFRLPPGVGVGCNHVAVTFDTTLHSLTAAADKANIPPVGHMLLTACAYLAPDDIPMSLLQLWLSRSYPGKLGKDILLMFWSFCGSTP
jgi:hypothetical protein